MSRKQSNEFYFIDWNKFNKKFSKKPASKTYKALIEWARKDRWHNPKAFDALSEWIRNDSEWTSGQLAANEEKLRSIFECFREQNASIRKILKALESSGVVNAAVFKALDKFDGALSGTFDDKRLREAVTEATARMLADFSVMRNRAVREQIAGGKTGGKGNDSVEIFGYINHLKDCDASLQWTLFMPAEVEQRQKGYKVASFEYKEMPALRFIGGEGDISDDMEARRELFRTLDAMSDYKSGFNYDVLLGHHYGIGVDNGPWHGFWGRFMKADTPVPEGMVYFDFVPQRGQNDHVAGPPFLSQFAFATYSGARKSKPKGKGYDSCTMYEITRNICLGQCVVIPYPEKYWTAEVFPDGCNQYSTAYMFGVEM